MIYGSITKCYIVGHGQRNEWECRLGYQVVSEDTETNTREILLQLEARSINRNYTAVGYLLTPTIDGQQLNAIPMNFSQANTNIWQVLGTKVVKIVGAYNGIKYGSFVTNLTGAWDLKSGSASVYIVLDNLHTPPQITSIDSQEINSSLNKYDGIAQFLSVKNYTFHTETFDDATISSYQIHHNGVLIGSSEENGMTINFDTVGTLATFEMNGKTYCTLKFVVIDNFGVSGVKETQVEVTKYVKPNLVQTSSSIKRNGQLSGKVKMTLVGSFFNQSINGVVNNIDLKFKYWKKGTTEPTEYNDIPYEATDNNISIYGWRIKIGNKEIEDVSSKSAYTFKIKATDYFNKTSEIELLCPVGEYLWAEFKDRVDFKAITVQGVEIIESGNNSYGDYIKFSDGTMICYGEVEGSSIVSDYWTTFKRTIDTLAHTFPMEFIETPFVTLTGAYWYGVVSAQLTSAANDSFGYVCLFPSGIGGAGDVVAYRFTYQAIGKWK